MRSDLRRRDRESINFYLWLRTRPAADRIEETDFVYSMLALSLHKAGASLVGGDSGLCEADTGLLKAGAGLHS